jgi:hypothetical protein
MYCLLFFTTATADTLGQGPSNHVVLFYITLIHLHFSSVSQCQAQVAPWLARDLALSSSSADSSSTVCCLQHCCFLKATYLICTQVLTAGQVCTFHSRIWRVFLLSLSSMPTRRTELRYDTVFLLLPCR